MYGRRWRAALLATAAELLVSGSAHATMPTLTELPKPAQPSACHTWASKQSQDAFDIWGIENSGSTTRGVAIDRLTTYCMGGKLPEIVGFGSSVGFNDAYCEAHRGTTICNDYTAAEAQIKPSLPQPPAQPPSPVKPVVECAKFEESKNVILSGYIVEYEMDEETLVPHTTMGLRLDKPICFAKDPDDPIDFLDIGNVDRKIVGRHGKVQGNMVAGDGWSIDTQMISADPPNDQAGIVWENVSYDQYMNSKSLSVAADNRDLKSIDVMQTYQRITSAMMFGKSEIDKVAFDCAHSRFQSLRTTWYEDQMATGRVTKVLGPGPWGSIPPYAIQAFARVCAP